MAYLKHISYYLPAFRLTNEKINQQHPQWAVEKISDKTGIKERRIAAIDELASDMACQAAEKLFADYPINKADIDYLLLCTQSPDYFLPTTACLVQHRLGLSTNIGALDFNLGCSGFVYGLSLAKGLIAGNMAKNVLLITAETYSKYIHPEDKSNLTIFGDAAAATLISSESGFAKIEDFVLGTDGSGAENLIVKGGGQKYPWTGKEPWQEEQGIQANYKNLYMDGPEIFNFTIERVPEMINALLSKSGLNKTDISLFVLHQANRYMLNHLKKKMGISDKQFYLFLENCGNTVSSTIPIALSEARNEERLIDAGKVLLAGFGVGYSWAACILNVEPK
jgi:3-oxoacyl-[acyl-carrier-protein] synthase-3